MNSYWPLRAGLFFYEVLRLLLLVIFLFLMPPGNGTFFPYLVYLSANAMFPLITLFIWLRPGEYRNYISLYLAGKIIGVVSFYAWEIFVSREFPGLENIVKSLVLFWGSIFISLADILSIGGAWILKKVSRIETTGSIESGGV